jgi:transposase
MIMRSAYDFSEIYLHRDPVDFRKWADGLVAIVKGDMQLDPFSSYLFLFTNRRRDRIKALYWDKTGYAVWYKRLEEQKFMWPRKSEAQSVTLSPQQLDWLLQGYDISRMKPHSPLKYASSF